MLSTTVFGVLFFHELHSYEELLVGGHFFKFNTDLTKWESHLKDMGSH